MKKTLVFALFFCLLGCTSNQTSSDIKIRLSNVSDFQYENIVVNTSTGDVNYGDLAPGEFSSYVSFDLAYRYAFVELMIDGETFTLQPIDYVGETPLENGLYTYQLDANDSQDQYSRLSLTLIED